MSGLRLKCTKFDFHWGYAPDPAGGAYSAPQTLIVFSISNISVDAAVDRYVSSGISGAQRRESEFLRELTSVRDRVLCLPAVFCQSDIAALIEHVCVSWLFCFYLFIAITF